MKVIILNPRLLLTLSLLLQLTEGKSSMIEKIVKRSAALDAFNEQKVLPATSRFPGYRPVQVLPELLAQVPPYVPLHRQTTVQIAPDTDQSAQDHHAGIAPVPQLIQVPVKASNAPVAPVQPTQGAGVNSNLTSLLNRLRRQTINVVAGTGGAAGDAGNLLNGGTGGDGGNGGRAGDVTVMLASDPNLQQILTLLLRQAQTPNGPIQVFFGTIGAGGGADSGGNSDD